VSPISSYKENPKVKIIWLASFPRSGNTWLRFLLHNYLFGEACTSREVSMKIPDLHLPQGYQLMKQAATEDHVIICKTHHPLTSNHPFLEDTIGYIYILRHPKDTLVSFLNFLKMVEVNIEGFTGRPEELQKRALRHWGTQFISNQPLQGWEHCGTWLQHVGSWTGESKFPKLVYRYEDMLDEPHRVFRKILMFLNEAVDEIRLEAAIKSCRINRLKRLEEKENEANIPLLGQFSATQLKKCGGFFRGKGKGQTLEEIDPQLDEVFDQQFAVLLARFGYQ